MGVCCWFRLAGPQRTQALARVPTSQLGIGGNREAPLARSCPFPGAPVVHDASEDLLSLAIRSRHGPVASGERVMPTGHCIPAGSPRGCRLRLGPDRGHPGLVCTAPDLPQLITDPWRRPSGLDRVGVAQVQQQPVRHCPRLRVAGQPERRERFVPGRPLIWAVADRFGPDWLGQVLVPVQLAVGADGAGAPLPFQSLQRFTGNRPERPHRPVKLAFGGVLADPFLALIQRLRDLHDVTLSLRVVQLRSLRRPRPCLPGHQASDALPDPGVHDRGHVPRVRQAPPGHRIADDVGGVEPGQLSSPQGSPQPPCPQTDAVPVLGRQRGDQQIPVPLVPVGRGLADPDRIEDGQVVGVGQVLPL